MTRTLVFGPIPAIAAAPALVQAQPHGGAEHGSPYAGLQTGSVTSPSQSDVEELRRGGGWGLALPAELNGVPGTGHVLELREELRRTPEQIERYASLRGDRADPCAAAPAGHDPAMWRRHNRCD